LDKCKISHRDAVHLLVSFLEAVSLDPLDFVINKTSIRNARATYRQSYDNKVKQNFCNLNVESIVLHWDTKLLENISGKLVDRLAIIGTGPNVEQLLGVPELCSGTGIEISSAIYDVIEEWSLLNKVQAFVFDTTASNTGRINGACVLLEHKIEREILFLGCRHHICEIILAAVFKKCNISSISGPDIPLFKRFKAKWADINLENYTTGHNSKEIKYILGDDLDTVLNFCNQMILNTFPRDDYKEFLELIIIFLGGVPVGGIKFKKPGPYHLARWMAKAIYSIKIYLFHREFILTKKEEKSLLDLIIFIVKCYIKYWFSSPKAHEAPLNDIEFLRQLYDYRKINKNISDITVGKIINHLYYLNEETVAFSIFDDRIDYETKKLMVKKMFTMTDQDGDFEENDDCSTKKLLFKRDEIEVFLENDNYTILLKLFGEKSIKLLERFKISKEFLKFDPSKWGSMDSYLKGAFIIRNLKVVNDSAERSIKLMEEFNNKITKDESQKQFLLKVSTKY